MVKLELFWLGVTAELVVERRDEDAPDKVYQATERP